jgi:hypothetical protein
MALIIMASTSKTRSSADPSPSTTPLPRSRRKTGDVIHRRTTPARSPQLARATAEISVAAIAAEAYAIYLERGGAHGHDLEDWLEAERRLTVRADAQ